MRKFILLVSFFVLAFYSVAQLSITIGKKYTNFSGINYFFVFNGIVNSTEITYDGTLTPDSVVVWEKFDGTFKSNQNYFSPENNTGYVVKVNGKIKATCWVIDYKQFLPVYTSFEPEKNQNNPCQEVKLLIDANVPIISYNSYNGIYHAIPREFNIKYQTKSWTGKDWKQIDTLQSVILPTSQKTVPAPFCNTVYKLEGDQFATDLEITPASISSTQYQTSAVICHLTTAVTSRTRDKNNEAEAPADKLPINYSAPIDVQFLSNGNEPVAQYYNWTIYKGNELLINRKDKDHRYTFTDAGTYKVKVTASNSICSYSDSISVIVSTSDIKAPNVFTPNGDGYNDEFRVAYKSIISFQCWVYNRWGRQVYTWTDPTKGWDGKINGVDAKPGPYFYVIKAKGSDYDPNSTPDSKTHRRVGEHLLKGDINLLRGVQ